MQRNAAAVALLEKIVNINSGSMNLPGVVAVKDVVAPLLEALGFKVRWVPMEAFDKRGGTCWRSTRVRRRRASAASGCC